MQDILQYYKNAIERLKVILLDSNLDFLLNMLM